MRNHSSFILSAALYLLITRPAHAQYVVEKVNKKAAQFYSKAMELAESDDFKGGIEALQQAVKIDPKFEEAYLSLAGMYGEMKNYQYAIDNYEKAKAIDSVFFLDYNLPYSINLAGKGDFEKAQEAVNQF